MLYMLVLKAADVFVTFVPAEYAQAQLDQKKSFSTGSTTVPFELLFFILEVQSKPISKVDVLPVYPVMKVENSYLGMAPCFYNY